MEPKEISAEGIPLCDVLTCPYCGYVQQEHEPEGKSADMCFTQCQSCGKIFMYDVQVRQNCRVYQSKKDDVDIEKEFIDLLDKLILL